MQVIDVTIAATAIPNMQGNLSASPDQISWVLTSYIISTAIMTPAVGWLSARIGRRRLFIVSLAGFTVASFACGQSSSLEELVMWRLFQGALGAPMMPLSQSTLLDVFPRQRHGFAMGIWSVGLMIGPIIGPALGGYITEVYGWPWIFYINLPLGIVALLGIRAFVPESERQPRPFDFLGFAALGLGVAEGHRGGVEAVGVGAVEVPVAVVVDAVAAEDVGVFGEGRAAPGGGLGLLRAADEKKKREKQKPWCPGHGDP